MFTPARAVALVCLVAVSAACQGQADGQAGNSPSQTSVQKTQPNGSQAAAAGGPSLNAETQNLLAAARSKGETSLSLSWSGNTLGGSDGVKKFEALFNASYGTNIKVDFTPGPSMTDMAGKVSQEVAAGRATSTDILIGTDSHYIPLIDRDVLESYDYVKLIPGIAEDMIAPKNAGVEIYGTTAAVLYNTNLVSGADVPKKLEDVLNPKWKGKIASNPDAAYLDIVALRPEWGPDKMKSFVSKLSGQVGGLLRVGEEARIVSGEFSMLVMGNTHSATDLKGAPIRAVIPSDAGVVRFVYLSVPRTAAHPNLAKLYINMMLSQAGQKLLYDVYSTDHYELAGSRSAEDLKQQGIDPGSLLRLNIQLVAQHPELSQISEELSTILRAKR